MLKSLPFKSSSVHFDDQGSGKVVVLLHGYLETMEIWGDFATRLAQHFRVLTIDIPGHGKSGKVADVHTTDLMAEAVDLVLTCLRIEKCFLIGHSMGGYVALAFMAKYRYKTAGICLLHSNPFADTEEKKKNRDNDIQLIKDGKLADILSVHVPKEFANDNIHKFAKEIEKGKAIGMNCPPEGIIALIEGLKVRPDRQDLLKETGLPVLFVLGKKDNYTPYDIMHMVAQRTSTGEILTLEHSGHMGFIEEQESCLNAIVSFVSQF